MTSDPRGFDFAPGVAVILAADSEWRQTSGTLVSRLLQPPIQKCSFLPEKPSEPPAEANNELCNYTVIVCGWLRECVCVCVCLSVCLSVCLFMFLSVSSRCVLESSARFKSWTHPVCILSAQLLRHSHYRTMFGTVTVTDQLFCNLILLHVFLIMKVGGERHTHFLNLVRIVSWITHIVIVS